MSRDYTGTNPAFKVTDEVLRRDSLINNRAVLGEGSFYTDTLTLIVPSTGEEYTDYLPKVVASRAAGKSAKHVHCVLEFPHGIPEDLHATYQCVERGNFAQISQLTTMLNNLSDTADNVYYSEVSNRPEFLNTGEHEHLTKDLVVEAVVAALLQVRNFNRQEIDDLITLKLTPYQTITDAEFNTDAKTVPGAVNEVKLRLDSLINSLVAYQLKNDPTLDTTDKTVVGAINELLALVLGTTSKLDSKMDFIGAISTNVDLTPQCTGGSKLWTVMSPTPVTVTGKLSTGPGSFSAALGDVIYYDNDSGYIINSDVGAALAAKQDRVDPNLNTVNDDVVGAINEIHALVHDVRGTGEVPFIGYLSTDTNLTISPTISNGEKGYWVTLVGGKLITAPYSDGDVQKTLPGAYVVAFDGTHCTTHSVADYNIIKQETVDVNLNTTEKGVVGAINELEGLINILQQKDVMDFAGYLENDATLPGAIAGSTMWLIRQNPDPVTVTGIWSGTTEAAAREFRDGDLVFYDHPSGRLFGMQIGAKLDEKQDKTDSSLQTTDKTVVGAINETREVALRLTGAAPSLQGYLTADTNVAALCAGPNDKEWVIAKDGIRITAPFVSGGSLQTLNVGKVVAYDGNTGQTNVLDLDDYPVERLSAVEPNLQTSDKTIAGAINELLNVAGNSLAQLDDYLEKVPGGLNTSASSVVGAINELKSRMDTLFSSLNVQLDFMGYIGSNVDLRTQQTGTSKVWVVTGTATVTGNWLGGSGATAKACAPGDTIYYNSRDGKLSTENLGKKLLEKQDKTSLSLLTQEKGIVAAINEVWNDAESLYGRGDVPLHGYITGTTNLSSDSNVVGRKSGYWLVTRSSASVTAPWTTGTAAKSVTPNSVIVYDGTSNKCRLVPIEEWNVKIQPAVDERLTTTNKEIVGAINELKSAHTALGNVDVMEFHGYLSANTTINPSTPYSATRMYIVRTTGSITVTAKWYGGGSVYGQVFRDGDVIVWDKATHRSFYSKAGGIAYGKLSPTSNSLQTSNKNIVGAINEVRAQVLAISLSAYQTKSDSGLATTNKTIVGGINEVYNMIVNLKHYQVGDCVVSCRDDLPTSHFIPLGSSPVQKSSYGKLWAVLGVTYGGDGFNTFGIPPAPDTALKYYIVANT